MIKDKEMIEQTHNNKHGWQLALDLEITKVPEKDEDKIKLIKKIESNEIFDLICAFLGDEKRLDRPNENRPGIDYDNSMREVLMMQFTDKGWIVIEQDIPLDLDERPKILVYLTLNQRATDEDQTKGLSRSELREQREFQANKLKRIEAIFEGYYGGRVFSRTYIERLK